MKTKGDLSDKERALFETNLEYLRQHRNFVSTAFFTIVGAVLGLFYNYLSNKLENPTGLVIGLIILYAMVFILYINSILFETKSMANGLIDRIINSDLNALEKYKLKKKNLVSRIFFGALIGILVSLMFIFFGATSVASIIIGVFIAIIVYLTERNT